MKRLTLQHQFVRLIPDTLEEGTLYVSLDFATAVHKCCCGCGSEVVTPLSPTDWKVTFDGRTVSLYPSIGNWSFPCQSHYWVKRDRVVWDRRWSRKEIEANRRRQRVFEDEFVDELPENVLAGPGVDDDHKEGTPSLWSRLRRLLR